MLKKVFVIWACVAVILALAAIKIREYKRDFIFQQGLTQRLEALETKQDEILKRLDQRPGMAAWKKAPVPQRPPEEDLNKVYTIDLGRSPVKGDPKAQVTIVEFSDIQCPFSQRFHPMVLAAAQAYPQGVRYIFKSYPLSYHDQARPAAKALWAANEQGKYWDMLSLLFQNGKNLNEEKIKACAREAKLNVDRFARDLKEKDDQFEKLVEEDMAAARQAAVSGTPTFYIYGKKTNARTVEALRQQIDQLLKK